MNQYKKKQILKNTSIMGFLSTIQQIPLYQQVFGVSDFPMGIKIVGCLAVGGITIYGYKVIYKNWKINYFQPKWAIETSERRAILQQNGNPKEPKVISAVTTLKGDINSCWLPDGHLLTRIETTNHWWGALMRLLSKNPHYGYNYITCFPMNNTTIARFYDNIYPNIEQSNKTPSENFYENKGIYGDAYKVKPEEIKEVQFTDVKFPQPNDIPPTPYISIKPDGTISVIMYRVQPDSNFVDLMLSPRNNDLTLYHTTSYRSYDIRKQDINNITGKYIKLRAIINQVDDLITLPLEKQLKYINNFSPEEKLNMVNTITFGLTHKPTGWVIKNPNDLVSLRLTVSNTISPNLNISGHAASASIEDSASTAFF